MEMDEIIKILKEHNCEYLDENLEWGARLSDYGKYFYDKRYHGKTFVGIELLKDCEPPLNYIEIDHHNNKSNLPSSIKQVACLLSVKLTREQLLVSANDSGYIPALIAEKATDEEIIDIRNRDRSAQGVSREDEEKAKESLKSLEIDEGFALVKSLTDRFSAVTDAIYIDEGGKKVNRENIEKYKRLIVFNDKSLNYYGDNVSTLKKSLPIDVGMGVYSGVSFFGVTLNGLNEDKAGSFNYERIQEIIANIKKELPEEIKVEDDPTTHSYHIFMLPFRFEYKKDRHANIELQEVEKCFNLEDESWKKWKRPDKSNDVNEYNEKVYFYDFARKALFDNGKEKDNILIEFSLELNNEHQNTYRISLKSGKSYLLNIDSINVIFYDTNVGVLSFKLKNSRCSCFQDILNINDFGRRIYPQYLTLPENEKHYKLCGVKDSFLADCISININGECLFDNFEKFSEIKHAHFWNNKSEGELELIPVYVKELFPSDFLKKYSIFPIKDDRMFVMTWYVNDGMINSFKEIKSKYGEYFYNYCIDENWYRYVFVDNGKATNENYFLKKEELSSSSYGRWIDSGALYGVTNYSFVFLGSGGSLRGNFILEHMKTMYYRMAFLSLAQKAAFLHFSQKINEMSDSKVIKFHKKYLDFMDKVYFNEVTAQTQGIDLYNMLNDKMQLKASVRELQRDFKELSMNVELDFAHKLNGNLFILTLMSLFLLGLSTIYALLPVYESKERVNYISAGFSRFCDLNNAFQVLFDLTFASIFIFIIIFTYNYRLKLLDILKTLLRICYYK